MTDISRVALFGKLNAYCYQSLESCTVFCKLRGNPWVEPAHWLFQILQQPNNDLACIIRAFACSTDELTHDVQQALDSLPRGASSLHDFSSHVEDMTAQAWLYASLLFDGEQVRSGHLILAMLKTPGLRHLLYGISGQFRKIDEDRLAGEFHLLLQQSSESACADSAHVPVSMSAGNFPATGEHNCLSALQRYTVDLTEQARQGLLDQMMGREAEIRQLIDILLRRRQNNPILTGEAGVGKTAVVEGLARRMALGDVPPVLRHASIRCLDMSLLQAGASMRGEFEQRLRQVVTEVQASATPIILFIDEVHNLVGAGGYAGSGDAANLLKPMLARGSLRTIGATTWAEYKKYIEKDPALSRRFQRVEVQEPDEVLAVNMLRSLSSKMAEHHRVLILDEALTASVRLTQRYLPEGQLPDKAVRLLDTACARVALSQSATPAQLEDVQRQIATRQMELAQMAMESKLGIAPATRAEPVEQVLALLVDQEQQLRLRWQEERLLLEQVQGLQRQLLSTDGEGQQAVEDMRVSLRQVQVRLAGIQGEQALVLSAVDQQAVACVLQDWTGIPLGRLQSDSLTEVLNLELTLSKRILGQAHALAMIAQQLQSAHAGLDQPDKPIGVFLLAGPSGVGKTETALALAEALYGGEQQLITLNMSEYQEAHSVSTLKGAPPGYVGYGEGGVLTEAVRRRPWSVLLLDEIEKAHPDVHQLFFQVFDKGWMEDGEGRRVDFKNTLILLTSNVGSDVVQRLCEQTYLPPTTAALMQALRQPMLDAFPAALLGRMQLIPYRALSDDMLQGIVHLQLARLQRRVEQRYQIPLRYQAAVVAHIVQRCIDIESGGRMVEAIINQEIIAKMSTEFLRRIMIDAELTKVELRIEQGECMVLFS
ncbi:type VI secretion system ATPase TssH [Chromobacterium haemolyticum]|uniref:ClpV1 family T6SS ATPase n=1 Tax=Chromobacterium haemolyticum TaxID=394935 RepID=A0A1W0CDX3_9NEIS|nr:type VI secretion system ATPase TssH [Chromobacterium haemolyticum]OQS32956.1 ClpV1 family T6SS ATPase [Chromobacterium haemolyticum]